MSKEKSMPSERSQGVLFFVPKMAMNIRAMGFKEVIVSHRGKSNLKRST